MSRPATRLTAIVVLLIAPVLFLATRRGASASAAPARAFPAPPAEGGAPPAGAQTVVFSGGCFWGVQAVFEHVKGVTSAVSGYAGGDAGSASYEVVSGGDSGHAESVRVVYDPAQVTYGQLLRVFFSVAHDPTQLDRQGPDVGPQYRSAVWYTTEEQRRATEAYVAQLTSAKVFPRPIVTRVAPLRGFYPAEAYHQDYALRHPDDPYIAYNDAPKVARLERELPELWRAAPVTVAATDR